MTFLSPGDQDPFGPIFLERNLPIECFSFSEDQSRFLSHLRLLCLYITAYYSALPTFHSRRAAFCRYLSHLRMTCREYRSVHVIRVCTRQILALRELCAYCIFDPRVVSCWPMFADLSVVRRRSARCLLKLRSRLRQAQNRIHIIDTSRTICYILLFKANRAPAYTKRYFE